MLFLTVPKLKSANRQQNACISMKIPNVESDPYWEGLQTVPLKFQFPCMSRVSARFSDQTSKTVDFCRNNAEFDTISSLVIKPNP